MAFFEIKVAVVNAFQERQIIEADNLAQAKRYPIRVPRSKIVEVIKCTGAAHSNVFIDNCMMCMPRWGWCEVKNEQ